MTHPEPHRTGTKTHLEPSVPRKVLPDTDTDALDDGQQDRAADGAVPHGLVPATHGERATGEEAGDDGVVGVLLAPDTLDGAVERREEAAPDAEVAAEDGGAELHGRDGAHAALAVGAVPEALDAVPDGAADGLRE